MLVLPTAIEVLQMFGFSSACPVIWLPLQHTITRIMPNVSSIFSFLWQPNEPYPDRHERVAPALSNEKKESKNRNRITKENPVTIK